MPVYHTVREMNRALGTANMVAEQIIKTFMADETQDGQEYARDLMARLAAAGISLYFESPIDTPETPS